MGNYLRAEFYKVTHRKYTYGFFLTLLAGAAFLVGTWVYTNSRGNTVGFYTGVGLMATLLELGFYVTLVTGDIAFSDQYKFNTLKNEVSYGLPRVRIYLGKLVTACAVALAACVLVVGFYLALCWVLLPHDPALDAVIVKEAAFAVLAMLPLWLGAQALTIFFFFALKSSTAASFAVVGVLVGIPQILKLLTYFVSPGFAAVRRFLLIGAYDRLPAAGDRAALGYGCAVGAAWFLAATAAGILALRSQEIN